ncbi:hypothetical protein LJC04_05885 [Ruminococcaceae bacterium OttesenSCG-928-O06]|nr:hypothetical protein [Ruminococcaceae bacterium OttesenSCG-928-O06]
MNPQPPENKASPELDAMRQELMKTQLALGKNLSTTSQFLRFALALANENLGVIRSQLETLKDLAMEIDEWGQAS